MLGWKYINFIYNPTLYNCEDDIHSIYVITNRMLRRYDEYLNTKDDEKYKVCPTEIEIIDLFNNIIDTTKQ